MRLILFLLLFSFSLQARPFGGRSYSSGSSGGGSGITSLNGLTGATQTFATPGTSGTAPDWSSGGTAHTLNIPMASASSVTAGLISKTTYDLITGAAPATAPTFATSATFDYCTATTVPYFNASKQLVSSAVTPTELGYLTGVSSAIQTQLGTKAPTASPTFTGTIGTPLTASRVLTTDGSGNLAAASTTTTTLGFLDVGSSLTTLLAAKAPTASPTFSGTITTPLTASRALTTGSSSELAVSATTATELGYVSGVTSAIQTQLGTKVPSISARYTTNAGNNLANSSVAIVDFEDIDFDTDTAVTTGASWKFTVPSGKGGKYLVCAVLYLASAAGWGAGEEFAAFVYKNGSLHSMLSDWVATGTATCFAYASGCTTVSLAAADYVDIRAYQNNGATMAYYNVTGYNHVNIQKVGN